MISLLGLLDDIASTLDDISVMTKIALKKTSAIMSDDLAVNSAVVHGSAASRELPIVKAIFLGSLLNKVYCIAGVMLLSLISEYIIIGILFLGGLYLSYEGAHKLFEKLAPHPKHNFEENKPQLSEAQKVKGAIRTDLVLSIEIIVIAKSALSGTLIEQLVSLLIVGGATSILIYGLVALLVKIDDIGVYIAVKRNRRFGLFLVQSMPIVMRGLGIVGTVAMFLVGGGIICHTFHFPYYTWELVQNFVFGLCAGMLVLIGEKLYQRLTPKIF